MKNNKTKFGGRSATYLATGLLAVNMLVISDLNAAPASKTGSSTILFTDSSSAVLQVDGSPMGSSVVASGDRLIQPFGIAVANTGEIVVSDTGAYALIGFDPASQTQRVISSGGAMGSPYGICVERSGSILVANGQYLLRVDPASGAQSIVASNGFFKAPVGVAVNSHGDIFVLDIMGAVIRVNPRTGDQSYITGGINFHRPQGIAANGTDLYVTDVLNTDGNFGTGCIIHIDAKARTQDLLTSGGNLVGPVGIAIDANGQLIVGDPYTISISPDLYDGAIIQIDPVSRTQTPLAIGHDNYVNPRGVALAPAN